MVATLLDDELLAEYAECRLGYGSLDAPVWFVGMEEGGGGDLAEVRLRLQTWAKLNRQPLDDLRAYHLALGFPSVRAYFTEQVRLQRTWSSLLRVLAGTKQQERTTDQLRQEQAHRLGRHGGETCLLELLPLPSPGSATWNYSAWSTLQRLASRSTYEAHYAPRRVDALRRLITQHQPALVCFYGLTHAAWWRQVVGGDLREISLPTNRRGFVGQSGATAYLLIEHPVAFGVTNNYFGSAGQAASTMIHQRP